MELETEKKSPNVPFIAGIAIVVALGVIAVFRHRSGAASGHDAWMTDLPAAQAKAAAEHKLVFMDFTGSGWCPPCKTLFKEVLSTPEFISYARTQLVLVEIDFPPEIQDTNQSVDLKSGNIRLMKQFDVKGFPTLVVLDRAGKEVWREEGYGGESPAEFIAGLQKLKP